MRNTIKKQVNAIGFSHDISGMLIDLVYAELFNANRMFDLSITISKFKNENPADTRVWAEVRVAIIGDGISMTQLMPFLEKGVQLNALFGEIVMRKTYYLYEE